MGAEAQGLAIERAITLAETSARLGEAVPLLNQAAQDAFNAAASVLDASSLPPRDATTANVAAFVAYLAAESAIQLDIDHAERAAEGAAVCDALTRAPMLADRRLLTALVRSTRWKDDAPVDPDLFGPLWPDGAPAWWPEEEMAPGETPPTLRLEFCVPHSVERGTVDRIIGDLLQEANVLHHAMGGHGLTIKRAEVHEGEPALVPCETGGGGR